MTGCIVMADSAAIIVAEGGPKAQKKYAHIVLNRIQWKAEAADDNIERYKLISSLKSSFLKTYVLNLPCLDFCQPFYISTLT